MNLALIDDDRLYHNIFIDHFSSMNVNITIFDSGDSFLSLKNKEAHKLDLLIIDHTLHDMKGADCIRLLRPAITAEICVISTYGKAVPDEFRKKYNITGDYNKMDFDKIEAWYRYFKHERETPNLQKLSAI